MALLLRRRRICGYSWVSWPEARGLGQRGKGDGFRFAHPILRAAWAPEKGVRYPCGAL